jgi:hypothetical protein
LLEASKYNSKVQVDNCSSVVAEKRTACDTSFDQNSSFEIEASKKLKIFEMSNPSEDVAIMIIEGGVNYYGDPSLLKSD